MLRLSQQKQGGNGIYIYRRVGFVAEEGVLLAGRDDGARKEVVMAESMCLEDKERDGREAFHMF